MTAPKVNTIKRGDSRFYVDPETGTKNPGVTSVLNMLPKGFLKFWASKVVAEEAIENLGAVVSIALTDPGAAIDFLKRAPDRFTRKAADTGTAAHDLFEQMSNGEKVNLNRLPAELRPFVQHFQEFLDVCEPEFIFTEETVWSDSEGYAGSFDAFMILHGEGAGPLQGKRLWADWKTTRSGVHEEVALQLSAYAHADNLIRPDGSRVPMPEFDGAAVLHVRPEGWALVPIEIGDVEVDGQPVAVIDYFHALRNVFDWDTQVKKHVIGRPVAGGGDLMPSGKVRINKPKAVKKKEASS